MRGGVFAFPLQQSFSQKLIQQMHLLTLSDSPLVSPMPDRIGLKLFIF